MAKSLYDVLGVSRTATPEEIRKAYKRRALETHPDRLPQGFTDEDKKDAEAKFREVSAAYEVLSNEDNRALYDSHGEWPPPEQAEPPPFGFRPSSSQHRSRTHSFPDFANFPPGDPFRQNPWGSPPFAGPFAHHQRRGDHPGFMFTDPMQLFNQLFGDFDSVFRNDPFFSQGPSTSPFASMPPMSRGGLFGAPFFAEPMFSSRLESHDSHFPSHVNAVSQSMTKTTINGRTETVLKVKDAEGNLHITRTGQDGRTTYTRNGVVQDDSGHPAPAPIAQPVLHPLLPPPSAPDPVPLPKGPARTSSSRHHRHNTVPVPLQRTQQRPAHVLPSAAPSPTEFRPYPEYARASRSALHHAPPSGYPYHTQPPPPPPAPVMPTQANPPLIPDGGAPQKRRGLKKWFG